MKLLTKEEQESYENAKICYICKGKEVENKYLRDKKYCKVRDQRHYTLEYRGEYSAGFMTGSLSNLVKNPSEGNYRIKCKCGHETCRIKYKYCDYLLE